MREQHEHQQWFRRKIFVSFLSLWHASAVGACAEKEDMSSLALGRWVALTLASLDIGVSIEHDTIKWSILLLLLSVSGVLRRHGERKGLSEKRHQCIIRHMFRSDQNPINGTKLEVVLLGCTNTTFAGFSIL
jgi:hypothetical protein